MNLQVVGRKLEDGTFKAALVADGKFQDAATSTDMFEFVKDHLMAVFVTMAAEDRVTLTVESGKK